MSDLTIFAVAYKPKKELINLIIERYSKNYPILIVNNSLEKLNENFYKIKNLKIFDNNVNNGNGAGINVGLKYIKTKYALYLDLDSYINEINLSKLIKYANKIKNFGVLLTNSSNKNTKQKIFKTWNSEGSIMLFNLKHINNRLLFDETYFLYFEETDFFYNCLKNNINVFFIPKVISSHARGTSIVENNKIRDLRIWHYSWSQFYFYKKNFSYFYALKKCLPFFFKDFSMIIFYFIKMDFKEINIRYTRISGLINSLLNFKSWKRNI